MSDVPGVGEAILEVIYPDSSRQRVGIAASPFSIGRGEECDLALADRRISRQCAAIVSKEGRYYIEDRGNQRGIFINREKIARRALEDGDIVSFGLDDSYHLVFRSSLAEHSIQSLLTRMDRMAGTDATTGELTKLNLLLEATRLLHSQLPLGAVLEAMLDRAITITDADRGLLLEVDPSGSLRPRMARRRGSAAYPEGGFAPSQTAMGLALIEGAAAVDLQMNIIAGSKKAVLVDLQKVSFLGSMGLRALVAPARAIRSRGGKMVLLGPSEMVEKVLKTSGIDTLIPVHHEFQTALAALQ